MTQHTEQRGASWIAGKRHEAPRSSGFRVERFVGGERVRIGPWPRDRAEQLEEALRAAAVAAEPWALRGRAARLRILRPLVEELARFPADGGLIAGCLGVRGFELEEHWEAGGEALEEGLAGGELLPEPAPRAPLILSVHWSELLAGLGRDLIAALVAGRAVVVLSDATCPALAQHCVETLAPGLPPGVVSLLHDDGRSVLRAAAFRSGSEVAASGPEELGEELRQLGLRSAASLGHASGSLPFGFGVGEVEPWSLSFRSIESGTLRVGADEDPEQAAARAVVAGLGRSGTFSGQLPGQTAHVACHPFLFSEFTESLLDALANDPALDDPVPCLDPSLGQRLEAIRREGLDEGATLLLEGPEASHGSRADARLRPLVFTNVEPTMRLAGWRRPAPAFVLRRWTPE